MGKSLEHVNCKVKKETAAPQPSILTEGQNGRRMLIESRRGGAEPPAEPPEKESSRDYWNTNQGGLDAL